MYVFPHFKSFCLVVLQLILSLKLSELEQFEKQAENCLFADKIEFFGKLLHPRAKLKETDPTYNMGKPGSSHFRDPPLISEESPLKSEAVLIKYLDFWDR